MIVPFAPGGTVDIVARILSARLSAITGQQVVVENRGGAGGILGTEITTQAAGDGYTILLHSSALAYDQAVRDTLPYDPLKDLAPVGLVGATPNLLVVNPSFPAHSALELIALAKTKPGVVTFGTGGVGSSSHLAVELFSFISGATFNHVAYRGAGPALNDVVAGHVNFMIATMPAAVQHVRAGGLRALGISSPSRSSVLPGVPTIAESGLPGYEFVAWFGVFAPGKTPDALVDRINVLLQEAMSSAEIREKLESQGIEPQSSTPTQFRETIRSEIGRWKVVARQALPR